MALRSLIQIWVMFRKDLKMVYRNPFAFGLLLVVPFLLMATISKALEPVFQGVRSFDVPVVDLDSSEESNRLIAELDGLEALRMTVREWDEPGFDEADASDMLEGSPKEFAVLVIPDGFGDSVARGDPVTVRLFADPVQQGFSRIITDQVQAKLATDDLLGSFVSVLATRTGSSEEEAAQTVANEVEPRALDPERTVETTLVSQREVLPSHFEQTVPGFSVMFTFWLAIFVAASIYAEKSQYHTWRRTLVAPMPKLAMMASRILAYVILGLAQLTVLFLLGWAVFGVDLGDNVLALWLILAAMAMVTTGFGILMSSLIKDFATLSSITNLAVIGLGTLGGALVPVFLLPGWMREISPVTPHYWALDAIQGIMLLGEGLTDVVTQLGALLLFAAFFFTLAALRFRMTD